MSAGQSVICVDPIRRYTKFGEHFFWAPRSCFVRRTAGVADQGSGHADSVR
ncbi:hypothetical protein X989_5607 [Burkholderia pseudomallei MSHR4378]|nr:hypothetical protein X989_5607 [Burkholderia pseudomallei MSHR4378]